MDTTGFKTNPYHPRLPEDDFFLSDGFIKELNEFGNFLLKRVGFGDIFDFVSQARFFLCYSRNLNKFYKYVDSLEKEFFGKIFVGCLGRGNYEFSFFVPMFHHFDVLNTREACLFFNIMNLIDEKKSHEKRNDFFEMEEYCDYLGKTKLNYDYSLSCLRQYIPYDFIVFKWNAKGERKCSLECTVIDILKGIENFDETNDFEFSECDLKKDLFFGGDGVRLVCDRNVLEISDAMKNEMNTMIDLFTDKFFYSTTDREWINLMEKIKENPGLRFSRLDRDKMLKCLGSEVMPTVWGYVPEEYSNSSMYGI